MDTEILHFGHIGAEEISFKVSIRIRISRTYLLTSDPSHFLFGVMLKNLVHKFFWDTLYI